MKRTSLHLVSGFLLIWLIIPGLALADGHGQAKQEIKALFDELAEDGLWSGSVLVAVDGKILVAEGNGFADVEDGVKNKPKTVFAIASMTKAFTAMSVMMLEERGLLTLDDTVAAYLPTFPEGDRITIRQLLNQTSGLFDYTWNPAVWENIDRYHAPEEILQYFEAEPLRFEPGSQFEYSNSNYVLAGLIVERVSGLTYRDFLWLDIFEPLGMDHTSYDPFEVDFPDKAVGYDDAFADPPVVALYLHPSVPYAAGAIYSTVEDLYRWDQALTTDTLVSAETLEKIFTPGLGDYGYGWYIDELPVDGIAHRHVWHWGAYSGFHSFISRLLDDRVTIILLSNLSPPLGTPEDLMPVVERVAEILFEEE